MVAFQTVFLGLVFGLAPVRVAVSPPVASVELLKDGVSVGTVQGEPWEISCNFGPAPLPHELVAVARDAQGNEVGRALQLVNLPRATTEATITVKPGATGQPSTACLTWSSIDKAKAKRFEVTLDGAPVKVKDPERIELPPVDLARPHFLAAEVVFPKGVVARAEASFGGEVKARAESKLTAYPVVLRPGFELPPAEAMQGWFRKGGQPLQVVAVEEGYYDVVLVFDQDSAGRSRGITPGNINSAVLDHEVTIQPSRGGNRLSGLWAVPVTIGGQDTKEVRGVFPASFPLDFDVDEVRKLIFRFPPPAADRTRQSLANAVASAGMQAAALGRRRAVVLLVGEAAPDLSTITPQAARAYLESMNVPLFIWTTERRISALDLPGWGLPDDASTDQQLQAAVGRLDKALRAQRIVWLAGSHLPSAITIAPGVRHIFPARGVVRQERK
ncbi:MAG: hypothetical protein MUF10_08755 [Thermoanaerobaculaceae bacterium]|jgi:hypothetical protein|nr:hypothetical protein [Thermoanaerobaculaceae bacterium]